MHPAKTPFVKVHKEAAEKAKKLLMRNGLIDRQRYVEHSSSYVLFPVLDIENERIKKLLERGDLRIVMLKGKKKQASQDYYSILKSRIGQEELKKLVKGYDLLGNIALVEIPESLSKRKKDIAKAILEANAHVETVLEKAGPVSGRYRTREVSYIAGKRSFIARYVENGCTMLFDVRKAFFSNRLSYERSRIAKIAKDGERVIVMFAGVGPFVLEIAKAHRSSHVIGIELNRSAYSYMKRNIELNNLKNASAVLGDVSKVYKHYLGIADRVVMPLPKSSKQFIKEAVAVSKKQAMLHIYTFCRIGKGKEAAKEIAKEIRKQGAEASLKFMRVVRPYSAVEEEVVLDFSISR
ncbi:MAG: class I SAM-dependent methyltransferase [Candidatus Micrarchaeia archaeon]